MSSHIASRTTTDVSLARPTSRVVRSTDPLSTVRPRSEARPQRALAHDVDHFARRRFTFVLAWSALGGAARQALQLARHLAHDYGAAVQVCALTDSDGDARTSFIEQGIPWHPLPFEWPMTRLAKGRALLSFVRALRRLDPDILMPFCSRPNILCGITWRVAGASLCVWHQRDVNAVTRFSATLVRRAALNTPLLMSNSLHGIEHLVATVGASRERVHYAPNAVDLPEPRATRHTWRGRLGAHDEDFVVCMLAHLRDGKDYDTLLRAWRIVVDRLGERGRQGVLVFAGLGPERDIAKARAFDLELGRTVRFVGFVEDVGGLVGACDAGVLSSLREGCPNGVLECMAGGLPVAGTDIAGIREAVGPEGYPLLASPGDHQALAAAIIRLGDEPDERRILGEQNRARIHDEFSLQRMLEAHTRVLGNALAERR